MRAITFLSLISSVLAVPTNIGITFGSSTDELPTLTLPYATYRAYLYDSTDDYYSFKNIRFAAPPLGDLRWAKPAAPLVENGIQDGTTGNQCLQATPSQLSVAGPFLNALESSSEDCLFLDILVPGAAVRGEVKDLPVLFWIFGGGYTLGSKSFFLYDGSPFLKSGNNSLIWVAANYRLGAFGFLNGPTVEEQGLPNAGFWDQRAALQWVQDYIYLLGGDKNYVTAMGQSAGAGSIMHHLVGNSGTLDPMFSRAVILSPAFHPQYDPDVLESQYSNFESITGCAGQGLSCMRKLDSHTLQKANLATVNAASYGTFVYGPAVDNSYIKDLPGIELLNGNYWKNIPVLLGHTAHEGAFFADPFIITNAQFDQLLAQNFPNTSTTILQEIELLYPEPGLFREYLTTFERLAGIIGEWVVTCNVRYLAQAYAGNAWAYKFSIPPAIHLTDLILAFWRTDLNLGQYLQIDLDLGFLTEKNLATGFQSYISSFARSGDPNTYREEGGFPKTKEFPLAVVGDQVQVLDVDIFGFHSKQDNVTPREQCKFWQGGTWTGRR